MFDGWGKKPFDRGLGIAEGWGVPQNDRHVALTILRHVGAKFGGGGDRNTPKKSYGAFRAVFLWDLLIATTCQKGGGGYADRAPRGLQMNPRNDGKQSPQASGADFPASAHSELMVGTGGLCITGRGLLRQEALRTVCGGASLTECWTDSGFRLLRCAWVRVGPTE